MRMYIESTIPSCVVARPARDLIQAARQQLTRDWWDLQREQHEALLAGGVGAAAGERATILPLLKIAMAYASSGYPGPEAPAVSSGPSALSRRTLEGGCAVSDRHVS